MFVSGRWNAGATEDGLARMDPVFRKVLNLVSNCRRRPAGADVLVLHTLVPVYCTRKFVQDESRGLKRVRFFVLASKSRPEVLAPALGIVVGTWYPKMRAKSRVTIMQSFEKHPNKSDR